MTNAFLHREIREKGGAYGGGANSGAHGCIAFYSYRDPNTLPTLDQFQKAVEWAANGSFSEEVRLLEGLLMHLEYQRSQIERDLANRSSRSTI